MAAAKYYETTVVRMQREKKSHLRASLITDIYARWTIGNLDEEIYKQKMEAYKEAGHCAERLR